MAKQIRVESGFGHIGKPSRLILDKEGKVPPGAIVQLNNTVQRIVDTINGALSGGNGDQGTRTGNFDGQFLEFTTPSTPDAEFELFHGLGRIPVGKVVVRQDKAASLYDSSAGSWTTEVVYFKCNVASVLVRIVLF